LVPGLPVIRWLVGVQVLNGLLLPIVLYFVIRLANDAALMADLKNTRSQNVVAWVTFGLVTTAVVAMLASQLLDVLGFHVLQS
jgi:Mn2+/Fe2+ NRAMP family transporter